MLGCEGRLQTGRSASRARAGGMWETEGVRLVQVGVLQGEVVVAGVARVAGLRFVGIGPTCQSPPSARLAAVQLVHLAPVSSIPFPTSHPWTVA